MKIHRLFLLMFLSIFCIAFHDAGLALESVPIVTNSPYEGGINPACGVCSTGTMCCGSSCVDPLIDENNCGGCGIECGAQTCSDGHCVRGGGGLGICPEEGEEDCGDGCQSLMDDEANCGACDNACERDQTCSEGRCIAAEECREKDQVDCGRGCQSLLDDPANCGACTKTCGADQECREGICMGGKCDEGQADCGKGCQDVYKDAANCGACAWECNPDQTCSGGVCVGGAQEVPVESGGREKAAP